MELGARVGEFSDGRLVAFEVVHAWSFVDDRFFSFNHV